MASPSLGNEPIMLTWGPWSGHDFFLDKMSLGDLTKAFFTHYSIQVYLVLSLVAVWISSQLAYEGWVGPMTAAVVTWLLYPIVEYTVHRFLLHSPAMFKSKSTAAVWKRIHFDHHQNPHDLSVLFGALYTTLPTITLITLPLGAIIAGSAGAAAAFAAGCAIFMVYEFVHCVQHLPFTPKIAWLRDLKHHHLSHHFHSEQGNYGITNEAVDKVFGTHYAKPKDVPRSPTRFNLGYDDEMRARFPWVAEISQSDDVYAKRRKRRVA